ncbi:amino acid ABC transporter ATP-binding/permease protein [Staphylococcus hyicus]
MERDKNNHLSHTLNIKWNRDIILAIILGVLGSSVALAMFFLSGYMITESALGAPLFALMGLIVTVKLFGFMRAVTRYYERLFSHRATFTMLRDVRVYFYQALIPIVPNVFRQFKTSDLLGRMVSQIEALQNIYLRVYYPPIVMSLTGGLTICVLLYFSVWHALTLLIVMSLSLWLIPWLSAKRATVIKKDIDDTYQKLMHRYFDYILGYDELMRFNQNQSYEGRLLRTEEALSNAEYQEQMFHIVYQYVLNIISMIAIWGSVCLIIIQVNAGTFDPVYATSIVLMLLTLFEQHVMMSQVAYYKSETDEATHQLNDVMSVAQLDGGKDRIEVEQIEMRASLFCLKNVYHQFPTQQRATLKGVHLNIKKGDHIAILGTSGSGKTTLLNILLGLYPISKGHMTIGGKPHFHRTHWLTQVNPLLQDAQFFDGTVKDNLLSSCNEVDCLNALRKVGLDHIPLSREVTLNKNALSGGEFQRLAIARLWLKQAPVWILDEPTKGIDAKRVVHIMQQIHDTAETLIVATHNLDILRDFDAVYKIEEGILTRVDPESLSVNA